MQSVEFYLSRKNKRKLEFIFNERGSTVSDMNVVIHGKNDIGPVALKSFKIDEKNIKILIYSPFK